MKCPYCSNEMEEGVVQSARQFYFTTKPKKFSLTPDVTDVWLSTHNMTNPTCLAFHCPECKKIVINYSENIE